MGEGPLTEPHSENEHTTGARGGSNRRPLAFALVITTVFLIIEIIGGLVTNSLALLADAGHMATDVAALSLSLFAIWLAQRPATPDRTYGFARAEVLAALVNAATLVAISIYIFWEAFKRIGEPPEVDSTPMLFVAVAGLLANGASAWILMRSGGHEDNLNTRGALLHVIGDILGSVGAIVAALIMLATGWYLADPILSAGIGVLILWNSWRLLHESVEVLLESTPKDIDTREVRAAMQDVAGVFGVHDLHIWTVTSGFVSLSAHVEVEQMDAWDEVLTGLTHMLGERFNIAHVTLQPESSEHRSDMFDGCSLETEEGMNACRVAIGGVNAVKTNHGHTH